LLTPTLNTLVKVISCQCTCTLGNKAVGVEVYFGTGINIDIDATKAISRGVCSLDASTGGGANAVAIGAGIVWPQGEGPVGTKQEIISCRGNVANDYTVTIVYRELPVSVTAVLRKPR